jgi:transposase
MFVVCLSRMRGNRASPGSEGAWGQQCPPATRRIQKLHSVGLLTNSFRPDVEMCALRAYLRHRADLLQHRASHILHMQKALQQMNIQLPQVLRDITGETGLAIVRAIVAGERDGVKLAQFRDPRCKSSAETIAKALTGTWKEEHLFALKQSLELYDFYTQQVANWDAQIQQQYTVIKPRWQYSPDNPVTPVPNRRRKKRNKNSPPSGVENEMGAAILSFCWQRRRIFAQ